jgi:hypothetical protein
MADKPIQNVTFQPTPEQIKFAEIYLDYVQKKTLEDIGKEIKVTRMTIWRWFQEEGFVNWLNSKKNELLNKSLMARYRTAIRRAEGGDFQFSKLLFEIQGEYIPQQKLGGMEDKPININLIPVATKAEAEKLKND